MPEIKFLIQKVREIPPTSEEVVEKFAGKCYLQSEDGLTLADEEVISIVDNWKNGCDSGRNNYLKSVGVSRPIIEFTPSHFDVFVSSKSGSSYWQLPDEEGMTKIADLLVGRKLPKFVEHDANPGFKGRKIVLRSKKPVTFDLTKMSKATKSPELHTKDPAGPHICFKLNLDNKGYPLNLRFPLA